MQEIEELDSLLPHRRPMTMLVEALPEQEPGTAVAVADTSESCIFFDTAIGGVPVCAALEYMAQAMALVVGFMRRRRGAPPKVGFVLGSRRMSVKTPVFRDGERYKVKAVCIYQDESFGSFDCSIDDARGDTVASAKMTAFQPDGEITEDVMERIQ